MTTEETLSVLRSVKSEVADRFKARGMGLFGSVARGGQAESSDVDVLVDFAEGADLLDLVGLALYLEELLHRKVDVVPRHSLRPELQPVVLRDLVMV